MNEVTRILDAIGQGDARAAAQLLPLVYDELRRLAAQRMAQEKPGQTLQPTALVHEAYLRLVGQGEEQHWDSRGHFFAAAAEAMRRILVDNARRKLSRKHGGGLVDREADPDRLPRGEPSRPARSDGCPRSPGSAGTEVAPQGRAGQAPLLSRLHDGRGGPDPGHRPGDGRRGLDLRQGLAASAMAPGRGDNAAD